MLWLWVLNYHSSKDCNDLIHLFIVPSYLKSYLVFAQLLQFTAKFSPLSSHGFPSFTLLSWSTPFVSWLSPNAGWVLDVAVFALKPAVLDYLPSNCCADAERDSKDSFFPSNTSEPSTHTFRMNHQARITHFSQRIGISYFWNSLRYGN